MIQVTARIFHSGTLIGYEVQDQTGQKTQLSKLDLWMYAKNKQVANVTASGNPENPTISGTNGFELKRLPEINWQPKDNNTNIFRVDKQDLNALLVREILSNGSIPEAFKEVTDQKQILKELKTKLQYTLGNDETFGLRFNSRCNSIEVVNTLRDDFTNPANKNNKNILGYKIRNVGSESIEIQRIGINKPHNSFAVTLEPGDSMNISRVELTVLTSGVEFSHKLSNGKMCCPMLSSIILKDDMYKLLQTFYFVFNEEIRVLDERVCNGISTVESQENILNYFVSIGENKCENNFQNNITQSSNKNIKKGGLSGIFNMFKH